jgi:hypothetical protein
LFEELPQGIRENLVEGETISKVLKTFSIINKPNYTLLTDRRILYFDEKHLGRYDLVDIPYSKLKSMRAERGVVTFGSIEFIGEQEEDPVLLSRIPKDEIEPFIKSLEDAINDLAVEPISIKRKRSFLGKMEWEFKKESEMLFRTKNDSGSSNLDPLNELKLRFVKGDISEEEYLRMKKILE